MASSNNAALRIGLQLPSRLDLLGVVDKVIEGITEQMEFDDVDRDAIAISVIEASTNAIQHGHETDPTKPIDIVFEIEEDRLVVTVHDHGVGYVPDLSDDPTPPDLLSTRGRGIFIMRSMMDEVTFDVTDGTLVRLVKEKNAGGGEEENSG
jgi:serine/threonine-protein kinase RsbW